MFDACYRREVQNHWVDRYAANWHPFYQEQLRNCEAFKSGNPRREDDVKAAVDVIHETIRQSAEKQKVKEDWENRILKKIRYHDVVKALKKSPAYLSGDPKREPELLAFAQSTFNELLKRVADLAVQWNKDRVEMNSLFSDWVSMMPGRTLDEILARIGEWQSRFSHLRRDDVVAALRRSILMCSRCRFCATRGGTVYQLFEHVEKRSACSWRDVQLRSS